MNIDSISVFSTLAHDILKNQSGKILSEQEGGPLLFIEQALNTLNVPFTSLFGDKINVEILMTAKGEFGTIPIAPKIKKAKRQKLSNWAIVSTLLNEWDISDLTSENNLKLFVDLQGFVRDGKNLGKKHSWKELLSVYQSIDCIKGTEEEISYLPRKIIDSQKNKMLLITKGSNDVDLYYKNQHLVVPVKSIDKPKDTIGAGDTFFGYFVGYLFLENSIVEAASKAVQATSFFLKNK